MTFPKYLRVALTEQCPMRCSFCHNEGAEIREKRSRLMVQYWERHISEFVDAGVKKVKFVGGEPLLYLDLPMLIQRLRCRYPDLDMSIITSGSVSVHRLKACFEAGLSRANMSIHGWRREMFERNSKIERHFVNRHETLQYLLDLGKPLKLNYVYTDALVEPDLQQLLTSMQNENVVINVLDDLSNRAITPQFLISRLTDLMGIPKIKRDLDPNSFNTLHLSWGGRMSVEIKDQHLGELAPWKSCDGCPKKLTCTEGIHAIRMYANGQVGLCMDRPDVRWSLSLSKEQSASAVDFVQSNLAVEKV